MPELIWSGLEGIGTLLGIGASADVIATQNNSNVTGSQLMAYAGLAYAAWLIWGKK